MNTKFAAALVALTLATGISFPAAADEATASDTGTQFAMLIGIATLQMSEQELAATRGAAVAVQSGRPLLILAEDVDGEWGAATGGYTTPIRFQRNAEKGK